MTGLDIYVDGGYRWNDIPMSGKICLVISYDDDVGDWNCYVNGVAQAPYTGGLGSQAVASQFWIGTGFHGPQKMDFGEARFFGTPDSGSVEEKAIAVSAYLMSKWGIS